MQSLSSILQAARAWYRMERTAGEPKLAGEGKLRGGRATTPPDCEGPPPPQPAYIEVLACAAQVVLCGDVVQSTVTVEELTDCSGLQRGTAA